MSNQFLHDIVTAVLAVVLVTATVIAHIIVHTADTSYLDASTTLVMGYFFGRVSGGAAGDASAASANLAAALTAPAPSAARPALKLPPDEGASHGGG